MSDMCTDNRFELVEEYKKELVKATNIESSPEEMKVLDNILFRFWQIGWLDSIDRMPLVKESAMTLMRSGGDSVYAKALRNAGRFIQNAIDGEAPEFEKIPFASPNSSESPNGWIPCEKKLPEKSEKYEVTIKNVTTIFDGETGEMVERVGYYVDCDIYKSYLLRKWHRYDGGQVIAWRKLPEPYQPKEDES